MGRRRRLNRADHRTRRSGRADRHGAVRRHRLGEGRDLRLPADLPRLDGQSRHSERRGPVRTAQLQALATLSQSGDQYADERHLALQGVRARSEEHTSELQSLMRTSYAVFCLKKKTKQKITNK